LPLSVLTGLAGLPVSANATASSSVPQARQNFTSSAFGVAHLGQYIRTSLLRFGAQA
jgi:hypothetical protein